MCISSYCVLVVSGVTAWLLDCNKNRRHMSVRSVKVNLFTKKNRVNGYRLNEWVQSVVLVLTMCCVVLTKINISKTKRSCHAECGGRGLPHYCCHAPSVNAGLFLNAHKHTWLRCVPWCEFLLPRPTTPAKTTHENEQEKPTRQAGLRGCHSGYW